jgi:hypothetical protein
MVYLAYVGKRKNMNRKNGDGVKNIICSIISYSNSTFNLHKNKNCGMRKIEDM